MSTLDDRLAALDAELAPLPGVLVAFSGGVDSGVVLAAAVRKLGPGRVVAATAVSPSLPATERVAAAEFAASLGVRHEQPRTDELSREGYRANAGDRCAFCKAELVDVLTPLAVRLGIADVVTGTNADDLRAGFRPGIRAAAERGAWAPLARAGLTKDDVRAAARRWGLPLADKPAAACLASRIAYGVPVSADGLARVEAAEAALRAALDAAGLAVANLRVRDLGSDIARVEVDRALVDRMTPELLAAVAGFDRVEVDPRGFRSGSMNELLPDPVRYR
ncbi:MAG: ATP-dependent sacrificial sulfur transferase LarE [Blastococcus sp.]